MLAGTAAERHEVIPQPHVVRRGSGTVLLAIHGNGVDHRLLLPLDDCLSNAGGWERVYLDLPGFGATPPLNDAGGLPEVADWLCGAVETLTAGAKFAILANSLGALLARHLAARFPNRVLGMALIAPVVDPVVKRRRTPQRVVLSRDDTLLASLSGPDAQDFAEMAVVQSPETWERFRTAALPGIRAADPAASVRLARRYQLATVPEEEMPMFARPTLIVTGRQDHVVGHEDQADLAQHYPRATVATLDRAGHNVHLEQPTAVEALMRNWLDHMRSEAQ